MNVTDDRQTTDGRAMTLWRILVSYPKHHYCRRFDQLQRHWQLKMKMTSHWWWSYWSLLARVDVECCLLLFKQTTIAVIRMLYRGIAGICILLFLYTWVYGSQGLKTNVKSKLEWLLVRNVVDHESVVQKNRVETLQRHRQTLEQKWWRLLLTRETVELVTEITQELQSWQAEGTQMINGNRLNGKIRCQVGVFCQLPLSRHFCYRPHTGCRPVNIRLSQGADHSYVPSQWFSALPRD